VAGGRTSLPLTQLVALASSSAHGLGDAHVTTALVVSARKHAAENWLEPGSEAPGGPDPRVWVIVIKGRFVCRGCSYPSGARPPRGHSAQSIWIPGQGVSDFGLGRKTQAGLSALGTVRRISLVPSSRSRAELVLAPGVGLGPVALGAALSTLQRRLGPAIEPGDFAFGSVQVYVQHDGSRRIDELAVTSPLVTVDGAELGAGFGAVRRHLTGWTRLSCPEGEHALQLSAAGGISTVREFAGNRFSIALVGSIPPGTCVPRFPANPPS
jgi:hypothetical protein